MRLHKFKKSSIRETRNLSTIADSSSNTILERLRDKSQKGEKKLAVGLFFSPKKNDKNTFFLGGGGGGGGWG